jgi:hypothetical protein
VAILTSPPGRRDFTLVVDGTGEAVSDLCLTDYVYNFAIKPPAGADFKFGFLDNDDFQFDNGGTDVYGKEFTGRKVDMKCYNFRFKLTAATPGTYSVRVHVH